MKDLRKSSHEGYLLRTYEDPELRNSGVKQGRRERKDEWLGHHHGQMVFHPARFSKGTNKICLRIVPLEWEVILFIGSFSPVVKCDFMGRNFPTPPSCVRMTGTREQSCCHIRQVSWGLNKAL